MVDTTQELCIECDASDYAMGAILFMKVEWHPCAYLFKGLNDGKCNYDVHDKGLHSVRPEPGT